MSYVRKTISREVVVDVANEMITHLADSGTQVDKVKREAIIAVTDAVLLRANSYNGFKYVNPPAEFRTWEEFHAREYVPGQAFTWDDTRKLFL